MKNDKIINFDLVKQFLQSIETYIVMIMSLVELFQQFQSSSGQFENRKLLYAVPWNLNATQNQSSNSTGDDRHWSSSIFDGRVRSTAGDNPDRGPIHVQIEGSAQTGVCSTIMFGHS